MRCDILSFLVHAPKLFYLFQFSNCITNISVDFLSAVSCLFYFAAPPIVKRTVTVTLNDAADCSSFSLTAGCHFDETCESDGEADEDDILRSFEETVLLSSNDLAAVIRLRFVLYHEGRLVATYRCLRVGSKLCLMAPKTEDCSGSA